jgi:hypothetical protein
MVVLIERVTRKELCASVCFVLIFFLGGFCEVNTGRFVVGFGRRQGIMATDGLDVDSNGVLENGGSYDNGVESRNGNAKDHGWKKVTNVKKQRRQEMKGSTATGQQEVEKNGAKPAEPKGFQALETEAAERRKRREARIAAALAAGESGEEQGDVGGEHQPEEGTVAVGGELKKMKPKKSNKPKVTVADAAAAIDPSDLSTFLADITVRS